MFLTGIAKMSDIHYTKSYEEYKRIFEKTSYSLEVLNKHYSNDPESPFIISAYENLPNLTNRLKEYEQNLSRSIAENDTYKELYFQNEIFHIKIEINAAIKRSLPVFYFNTLVQKKKFEEIKLNNYKKYKQINKDIKILQNQNDLDYCLDYKEKLINLVETEKTKYETLKSAFLNARDQISIVA